MDKKLKEIFFDATTEGPDSWLLEAMQLKSCSGKNRLVVQSSD